MFKVNNKKRYKKTHEHEAFFIFLSGLSFTGTDNSQDSRGREGTIFYSTLPLPPAHEHSDIYLQLRKWDDYHIFSIAMLAFTRRLLDEIYHRIIIWLIDLMLIFVHLLVDLILAFSNGWGNMFNLQILLMLFPLCMCQIAPLNVRVKNNSLKIM